jgi:hypothetical protein
MDGALSIIPAIEKLFSDDDVSAVAMNWACFGSAGAVFKEDTLVPERFTRRADSSFFINRHYKSLVRPKRTIRFINPHQALMTEGRYVMANGDTLVANEKFPYGLSQTLCWEVLRVNHYVVKSLEEFLVRKSRVGSASQAGRVKHRQFFEGHDRNEQEDESMLAYKDVTYEVLEDLRKQLDRVVGPEALFNYLRRLKWRLDYGFFWWRRYRLYVAKRLKHKKFYKESNGQ